MKQTIDQKLIKGFEKKVERAKTFTTEFIDSKAKSARIKRARKDYDYFVKTYFSHMAEKPCGKFQIEAANHIKNNPQCRTLFEWARGHAKSTHISLLIPLWLMIQEKREINVMVLVSKSEDMAIRLLSDLQCQLEYNKALISDFGTFKGAGSWMNGEFTTSDGRLFVALGRGQSPRGIKNNESRRVDYIVVDDIDDDIIIQNPKRIESAFEWMTSALMGTMDAGRGRFAMVGNRIGKNTILTNYAKRARFHTIVNILDKKGEITWRDNFTQKEVETLRYDVGERSFQKEYMNNPIIAGTIFQEKHIRYGKILSLSKYRSLICYTDPSFKNSNKADFKATVLLGKTAKGEYHIIKVYADQTSVKRMVDWHYEIESYVNGITPVRYYMESNFMQDLLLDEFRKQGESEGHHIAITGDSRKKPDKFARIEAISPLFERGLVLINEDEKDSYGVMVLVEQLLMFERGSKVHDDAPDALEGAIFLLNRRTSDTTVNYRSGGRRNEHRY